MYPQNILNTLYQSLYVLHINYGLLLWENQGTALDQIKKKAIRDITYSNYIAHTEPPIICLLTLILINYILKTS